LNNAEILAALECNNGKFPREAIIAAIHAGSEIVPGLLNFITYARQHAEEIQQQDSDGFMGHMFAMYLLAQFREPTAYAPIVDLFGSIPDPLIHDITGDIITEDLPRILASVCRGDTTLIRQLIQNRNAGEYVRGACVESYLTLVNEKLISRPDAIEYYASLYRGGLEREPSHVWNNLVAATADLNPVELFDDIVAADTEELFEDGFISLEDIEGDKILTMEETMRRLQRSIKSTLIRDTVAEMEWWDCFKDHSGDVPGKTRHIIDEPLQPVRTEPKIGRNDPCPCGSGKKYKKCCGKNV
jgi:hypothetical protein